uniref:Uncharacterized protein n=1 Tax=Strigamia maritima TaxID=126957 RepID=T1JM40_STRMM
MQLQSETNVSVVRHVDRSDIDLRTVTIKHLEAVFYPGGLIRGEESFFHRFHAFCVVVLELLQEFGSAHESRAVICTK